MDLFYIIISALAPVTIALWYILKKDRTQPEPTGLLAKAFILGVFSAPLSLLFSNPLEELFELDLIDNPSIVDAIADAFFMAAIPEELAKFIMLWLALRRNPHFDEKFDGIVYAVCVGMGFAGIENIIYLFDGLEDGTWVGIGISRALFSIPGHFFNAILMGYYYGLNHFGIDRSIKCKIMILMAPILAHGIYDSIVMAIDIDDNENFTLVIIFVFLYFCNKLRKIGKEKINSLLNQ